MAQFSRNPQCASCQRGEGSKLRRDSAFQPSCYWEERRELTNNDTTICGAYVKGKHCSFAFPGGHPIFYIDNENNVLCPTCADKWRNWKKFKGQPYRNAFEDGAAVDYDINYEDSYLYCDECDRHIQSAYGEDYED